MHAGHPTLYSQEWKHANNFNITHWEQGIRLGSPTWTALIRRQRVLRPHGGCCYFFRNCFRDGNSIKVKRGHNHHIPLKIHRKTHMLEVGYFQIPSPHCPENYTTNMHGEHPTWYRSESMQTTWYYSLRAGEKARISPFIRPQRVLSPHSGHHYKSFEEWQLNQIEKCMDTILINHWNFIVKHIYTCMLEVGMLHPYVNL